MRYADILLESAAKELKDQLPSLKKHDYDTIDKLMQKIAKKHKITGDSLHNLFVKRYKSTPDDWIKGKLDEKTKTSEDINDTIDEQAIDEFVDWVCKKLKVQNKPKIELSMDTEEAQANTHTGAHQPGSGVIWVYANNRNLVDILRTVCHELVHVRQHELDMIGPDDSYPGSPIEMLADMVAGKLIKIYGKNHPNIFQ